MSLGTARNLYLVRINPSGWLAAENTSLIEGHSMKFLLRRRFLYAAVLLCLGTWSSQRTVALMNGDGDPDATHRRALRAGIAETIVIPGPLPSFLRMAGMSQEISPEEVVPLLARNVALYGFQDAKQTEFLVLLNRYVHLAREIQSLADREGTIRVAGCDDARRLVEVLGYKAQGSCGNRGFALLTADAERAFLTIDSGFPLTALERALQRSEPFTYSFPSSRVPVIFTEKEWVSLSTLRRPHGDELIDALLQDQNLDRLYWAFAKCDSETRIALQQRPGLHELLALVPAFELYGSEIRIHAGQVEVPRGSANDWATLVGERPNSPGAFVAKLLSKDHGWLAAFFDVVSRLNRGQQIQLARDGRLQRLYSAYRSGAQRLDATKGVYPKNADLLVFLTAVKWKENGEPDIPGDLAVWQGIFSKKNRADRDWASRVRCCATAEELLESFAANSHVESEDGPVSIFLTLSALDAGRSAGHRLSDETEKLIAGKHAEFNRWFPIFAEFPSLDDAAVVQFLSAADRVDGIPNPTLHANALGAFQAEVGLWQIFARQGEIPDDKINSSWLGTIHPFTGVTTSLQLFAAARSSLQSILSAVTGKTNVSQDEMIDLLAGPYQESPDAKRVHVELADRIRSVMDDQRLASLDTLFGLSDGLAAMAQGADVGKSLLPLAGDLREFEMPRPIFTGNERTAWSPLVYSRRHAELQVRTDLAKVIQAATPAQLEAARGQLTPFLRDTLVGLNYAYYEPPGAEVLHKNPLFVRSHDFSSISILGMQRMWNDSSLMGVGATAGGGAYLIGSLANLPYALAVTESELIAPKHVQALIWQAVIPDLLVDAVLPRWWRVSRNELHAATLYQRAGDELFLAAANNASLRAKVVGILSDRMTSNRLEKAEGALHGEGDSTGSQLLPAEAFYLSVEFRKQYASEFPRWSSAAKELDAFAQSDPMDAEPDRLAKDFGVPHSALLFTDTRGFLNMKPPPAFGGSASRLMAQSWESDNLYWARLADEMGYSPAMLNLLVPSLTRRMVVNIFATNIDDWPALSRAMRETGDEFRAGKIETTGVANIAGNE